MWKTLLFNENKTSEEQNGNIGERRGFRIFRAEDQARKAGALPASVTILLFGRGLNIAKRSGMIHLHSNEKYRYL